MPYLQDGDFVITEATAILQYAAYKTGSKDLLGKNPVDAIKVSQLASIMGDFRTAVRELIHDKDFERVRDNFLDEKIAPFMNKFSKNLGEKEYPLGYLTWADFELFHGLDVLNRMRPEFLAKWSNLQKFHERINSNDGIQTYRKSEGYPRFLAPPDHVSWRGEEKLISK